MFKKKSTSSPEGFDTLLGINSYFEGNFSSEGTVRVDGKVKGDLTIKGDIIIGENAVIQGNVSAFNVHLSGSIEGNINAKGLLHLLSTSKLYGDIQVHSFVADEGGVFQGKCSMLEIHSDSQVDEKSSSKKAHSSKDYKKSAILNQIYEDNDINNTSKPE